MHSSCRHHHFSLTWPRHRFFSINESTSKFIDFTGNPSAFYISDCYRTQYETQINENMKIHLTKVATSSASISWKWTSFFQPSITINPSLFIAVKTSATIPEPNQWCKHSIHSTESVPNRFLRSVIVCFALQWTTEKEVQTHWKLFLLQLTCQGLHKDR